MTRNHLRQHHGGNPAQGPVPEMANPSPSPAAGSDFPDAPDDDSGPVQDQPDLDAFAERLGLSSPDPTEGDATGARAERPVVSSARQRTGALAERAASAVATGLGAAASGLSNLAERIRPDSTSPTDDT